MAGDQRAVSVFGDQVMVVFADQDGNYYIFSRDAVERARVSSEEQAAIDRLLGGRLAGELGDVQPVIATMDQPALEPGKAPDFGVPLETPSSAASTRAGIIGELRADTVLRRGGGSV